MAGSFNPAAPCEAESKAEGAAIKLHHYLIIREDLDRGPFAAQLAHAAARSAAGLHTEGTHVVVLGVKDEAELLELGCELTLRDIPHVVIDEPDPPFHGAVTAIGVQPMLKGPLKRILGKYQLLKGKAHDHQPAGAAPTAGLPSQRRDEEPHHQNQEADQGDGKPAA